jgi:hypothetical protein
MISPLHLSGSSDKATGNPWGTRQAGANGVFAALGELHAAAPKTGVAKPLSSHAPLSLRDLTGDAALESP